MARKYELKRRAERQEETRRRIVEAAIDLHATVGPARTTVSAIAERAAVQRHTFYRHFPDERTLGLACSGLYAEQNPLPDPEPWLEEPDALERLQRGVAELYRYYESNETMISSILRDAEIHALTRELMELRFGPGLMRIAQVLAKPFRERGRRRARVEAAVALAIDFRTWQLLRRRCGLPQDEAVAAAVAAVRCQ
jgi:AcrR family transcriptional regulator